MKFLSGKKKDTEWNEKVKVNKASRNFIFKENENKSFDVMASQGIERSL